MILGVGVHNPLFGMKEIPGRPEIKGIIVGIAVQELLTKFALATDDMSIGNPGALGPTSQITSHASYSKWTQKMVATSMTMRPGSTPEMGWNG